MPTKAVVTYAPPRSLRPEANDPSPVALRLMKAPERDTLSPRERAVLSRRVPGIRGWRIYKVAGGADVPLSGMSAPC